MSSNGKANTSLPRIFYSVEEVAAMMGVCSKTVHRLIARRELKASNAFRHKRIHANSIDEFVEKTVK